MRTCPKCKADLKLLIYQKSEGAPYSGNWICEPCLTNYHVEKITRMGREVEYIGVVHSEVK
jgi:uncharacterized protein YbaR (Trm112 family)